MKHSFSDEKIGETIIDDLSSLQTDITWLVLGQKRQRGESYWVVQVFPLSRLGRQGISTNNLLFVVPFYEPSLLETGYFILRF